MRRLMAVWRPTVAFSVVSLTALFAFFLWDVYQVDLTVTIALGLLLIAGGRYLQSRDAHPPVTDLPVTGLDTVEQAVQSGRETLRLVFDPDVLSIDTRMLGWYRIGLGLVIVGDVLSQVRTFTTLYGSDGIFPYEAVSQSPAYTWGEIAFQTTFPIWEIASGELAAIFILSVLALAGIALAVGFQTRLATLVCFLGLVSVQARNPFMLSIADKILLLVVFWSIFLPLGARYSLDAQYHPESPVETVQSLAGGILLFQVILLYFINGYQKLSVEQGVDLEKQLELLPLLLAAEDMAWAHTQLLSQSLPLELQQFFSVLWTLLLLSSPLLLVATEEKRLWIVAPLIIAHGLMIATFRIGTFPYTMVLVLLLFIQPQSTDRLYRLLPANLLSGDSPAYRRVPPFSPPEKVVGSFYRWQARSISKIGASIADSRVVGWSYRAGVRILTIPLPNRDKLPAIPLSRFAILMLLLGALMTGSMIGFDERQSQLESGDYYMIEQDKSERYTPAAMFGLRQATYSFFTTRPTNVDWIELRVNPPNETHQYEAFNDRHLSLDRAGAVNRPYRLGETHRQLDTYRERFYRDEDTYFLNVARGQYYCNRLNSDTGQYADVNAESFSYIQVEEKYDMATRNTLEGRTHEVDVIIESYDCSKPTGGLEPPLVVTENS